MKIGVITFSNSKDNYGQILQAYALQEYLKNTGHEPFLIRYKDIPQHDTTGFKPKKILKYIVNLPQYIKWYLNKYKMAMMDDEYRRSADFERRDFAGFIKKHINVTDFFTAESIEANPPKADAYICGSDQIWAGDDAYYLSFAPEKSLKIAYAPSLGGLTDFTPEKEARMKQLISRLDRIGMREQSGVDTCIRLGFKDAVKVIDPTLLLNQENYLKIAVAPKNIRPYALVYLLGSPIKVSIEQIAGYVSSKGLNLKYIASQGRSDSFEKENPTIEEWLGLIKNANLVITNSFHCVVFALTFHRPLISIPLKDGYKRMNTRIEELLHECGLTERFTINIEQLSNMTEQDFNKFENYKKSQQYFSKEFLNL